jgi:hypothetical protein
MSYMNTLEINPAPSLDTIVLTALGKSAKIKTIEPPPGA